MGYEFLADGIHILVAEGSLAVDATTVFDAHDFSVYSDECCHFSPAGNDILQQFVASTIVEHFAKSE